MRAYPVMLRPIPRVMPWGGKRLNGLTDAPDGVRVGEAWILSVRDGAVSVVGGGPFEGRPLDEYLAAFPDAAGSACGGGFPLLIKLIDSADRLSVQVHPDDEYAARVEGQRGKCEMWYVIDAAPDAEIIAGLRPGVTTDMISEGEPDESLFRKVRPVPGDVLFIPHGLVHSIGAGVLLLEIQENSDLTYRISDFGRTFDGRKRELHLQKAADCAVNYSNDDIEKLRFSRGGADDPSLLCHCGAFTVKKIVSDGLSPVRLSVPDDRFTVLCVVHAEDGASLVFGDHTIPLSFGTCVFIPAGAENVCVSGRAVSVTATV